jgi:hypothetical protein
MIENKYQKKREKKDFSIFLKDNWFIIFLASSFLIVLISLLIQNLLPKQVPIQENTWNGVTPGHSTYKQLVEKMGEPLDSVKTKNGFKIEFKSDFDGLPNTVITDKEGLVQFIREQIVFDKEHKLDQYIDEFGQPDLVLPDAGSAMSLEANVFLSKGVVIMAHVKDGSVEGKWYFEPAEKQNFLNSWGENLSENAHGPEGPN